MTTDVFKIEHARSDEILKHSMMTKIVQNESFPKTALKRNPK